MKRKIIKQGHNTLTVTLPSKWVQEQGLKAGDEIDALTKKEGLIFTTKKGTTKRPVTFDITGMNLPTIWKHFMGAYREGHEEIRVHFKPNIILENPYRYLTKQRVNTKQKHYKERVVEVLQGIVDRFVDLEIVDHNKNSIVIRQMSTPSDKEFSSSLRRVFLLAGQMLEEIMNVLKEKDLSSISHVCNMDINLDKFHDYCIRILNQHGTNNQYKKETLFSTLYLIELVGDEFKNMAVHLDNRGLDRYEGVFEVGTKVQKQWKLYEKIFFDYKETNVNELSRIDAELYVDMPEIYNKTGTKERELMHHFRILSRYFNALIELRIQMEYE